MNKRNAWTEDARKLSERLQQGYSGAVFDVMRERGFPDSILPSYLRPLRADDKIAGPAFTVRGERRELSMHESMLAWTEFLSKCPPGSVVVCQPGDHELAHMGELSAETLKFKGVKGYIVDGGCRDTRFIETLGFPVWCKYRTPVDICGRWIAEELGGAISIGDVVINNGDLILADIDGVAVIPFEHAQSVVDEVEIVVHTESQVRKAILQGEDPKAAYLRFGKF